VHLQRSHVDYECAVYEAAILLDNAPLFLAKVASEAGKWHGWVREVTNAEWWSSPAFPPRMQKTLIDTWDAHSALTQLTVASTSLT
jgi:hypothetical protein